jgi:thiamine pyrophosphate-dependent acetolactate synthase large subunit-like protein
MALKAILDAIEGLDAAVAGLYVKKEDGKFHLDIEPPAAGASASTSAEAPQAIKAQLAELAEKKKAAEAALSEVVAGLREDIPEEMRDLVPNIAPAEQIKWIREAQKKGIFTKPAGESGPDSKRPGASNLKNFEGMPPQAIMAQGYKSK